MQQAITGTEAFEPATTRAPHFRDLETSFVHHWAGLARAFGMDPTLGRVHALAFLHGAPIAPAHVRDRLDIELEAAGECLAELARFGVVRELADGSFQADADPWSWFLGTLKERGRREFAPILGSIREANRKAQELRASGLVMDAAEAQRIDRIARFTQFIDQIAGLLDTFASVGAGPMVSALRMVAKVRGPRLLRI